MLNVPVSEDSNTNESGWRIALQMSCRTLDDMFGDILSNLERSKELLFSTASIAHYQAAHNSRLQIESMFQNQQEMSRLQRRIFVDNWLNPAEHYTRHEQLCELRAIYPQTARWIFDEPSWKKWLNEEDISRRIFWTSGSPGAGGIAPTMLLIVKRADDARQNGHF
jgi:hypothetical protein